MDINASAYIATQLGTAYQRPQTTSPGEEQSKRTENPSPVTDKVETRTSEYSARRRVEANPRTADLRQQRQNSEAEFRQLEANALEESIELKPLVIDETLPRGVRSFLEVANMESDFHIIDTYA